MKTATPKLLTRLVFGELNHSPDYLEECSKFDIRLKPTATTVQQQLFQSVQKPVILHNYNSY